LDLDSLQSIVIVAIAVSQYKLLDRDQELTISNVLGQWLISLTAMNDAKNPLSLGVARNLTK